MKNKVCVLLIICLIATTILGLFFWALHQHLRTTNDISCMPDINALSIDGYDIHVNEYLDPQKRTAVVFFHPECEFCQQEIDGIINKYSECHNVQWVFLTLASSDEINVFLIDYPILTIPNSYVIREDWPNICRKLNFTAPPEMLIYDKNGKLIKNHKGATSIRTIVEELQ